MPKPKKKFRTIAPQVKLKSTQNTPNAQQSTNSKTKDQNQAKNQDNKSLKRKFKQQNGQNKRAKTNKQFAGKLQTNSDAKNHSTNSKSDKHKENQNKGKNPADQLKQKNKKNNFFQDKYLNQNKSKKQDQNNTNTSDKNEVIVNQQMGNKKQKTFNTKFESDVSSQKDLVNQNKSDEIQLDKDQDADMIPNSNWDKMKAQISGNSKSKSKHKFSRQLEQQNQQNESKKDLSEPNLDLNSEIQLPKEAGQNVNLSIDELKQKKDDSGLTRIVALDCEMVGVGFEGGQSVVARVSIVNDFGNVLYDVHVRPKMRVTDFRTRWSGIRPSDLKTAVSFEEMQQQVAQILQGRILVGHSLQNDLKVLQIGHPRRFIRDTARYPPLLYNKNGRLRPKSLKQLAKEQLQLEIQEGEHSSIEDARTALYVYHKFRQTWEKQIQNNELQGYKFARFPKRKDAVKKTKKDPRKDQKNRNKISGGEEDDEELYQSSFSMEKMESMQLRMNDPFSDPMADL